LELEEPAELVNLLLAQTELALLLEHYLPQLVVVALLKVDQVVTCLAVFPLDLAVAAVQDIKEQVLG
jgi:hypothetical protein